MSKEIVSIDDLQTLRSLMLSEKNFLLRLFRGNSMTNRSELSGATTIQLQLIIELLFCLANGEIPLKSCAYDALTKAKKGNNVYCRPLIT